MSTSGAASRSSNRVVTRASGRCRSCLRQVGAHARLVAAAQPGHLGIRVLLERRDVLRRGPADAVDPNAQFAASRRHGHPPWSDNRAPTLRVAYTSRGVAGTSNLALPGGRASPRTSHHPCCRAPPPLLIRNRYPSGVAMRRRRFLAIAGIAAVPASSYAPAACAAGPRGGPRCSTARTCTGWKVPAGRQRPLEGRRRRHRLRRRERGQGRQEPVDREPLRGLRAAARLADQEHAVRQPERCRSSCPTARTRRTRTARRSGFAMPDSDSGIYLRGSDKAQVNIWMLADRLGRSLRLPDRREDAGGSPRRRDAEEECRPQHRRMEHVRDHHAAATG